MTGKYKSLQSDIKRKAILKITLVIEPYSPEEKLWFRVIEQAIWDLGLPNHNSSDYFFKKSKSLDRICECLNIDTSIIFRILKSCEVL